MDRCKLAVLVPPLPLASNSQLASTSRSDLSAYVKSTTRWSERPMLGFIPFVNERDSMGKLITARATISRTAPTTPRPMLKQRKAKTHALRLCTRVISKVPAVGTYSLTSSWMKPSFHTSSSSSRKALSRFTSPTTSPSPQPVLFQQSALFSLSQPRLKIHHKGLGGSSKDYGPEWERKQSKNKFAALTLQGNPEEIQTLLSFQSQKAVKDRILPKFKHVTGNVYRKASPSSPSS